MHRIKKANTLFKILLLCSVTAFYSQPQIVLGQQCPFKSFCDSLKKEKTVNVASETPTSVPIPDVVDMYWRRQKKYFLVITATKLPNSTSDKEFAAVDGNDIANKLCSLGYVKLDALLDADANRSSIITSLKKVRTAVEQDESFVIIYYSGHGVVNQDNQKLKLQVSNEVPSEDAGISVEDVIDAARSKTARGQLVLLLDSCYSGQGTVLETLPYAKLKKTIVITSSGDKEPSYSMNIGNDKQASAFSYFFTQAVSNENEWDVADDNQDGVLTYGELRVYATIGLQCACANGQIKDKMSPDGHPPFSQDIIAYKPDKVKNFNTDVWKLITLKELEFRQGFESMGVQPEDFEFIPQQGNCPPTPASTLQQISNKILPTYRSIMGDSAVRRGKGVELGNNSLVSTPTDQVSRRLLASGMLVTKTYYDKRAFLSIQDSRTGQEQQEVSRPQPQPQTQETSTRSIDIAGLIPDDADSYALGLKALAERRHQDARNHLIAAEQRKKVDPQKIYLALGRNELDAGQYAASADWYRKALGVNKNVSPFTLVEAGNALRFAGDYKEAERLLLRALEESKKLNAAPMKPTEAIAIYSLAQLYEAQGKYDRAEDYYQAAIALWTEISGPESLAMTKILGNLASLYSQKGQYQQSLELLNRSLAILVKNEIEGQDLAEVLSNQGEVYTNLEKYDEAEMYLNRALEIYEKSLGSSHPRVAASLLNQAILSDRKKRFAEAEFLYKRVLEIQENTLGASHADIARTLEFYSATLRKMNREEDAQKIEARAKLIRIKYGGNLPHIKR